MRNILILIVLVFHLMPASQAAEAPIQQAWRLGDEARELARTGDGERAVALYDRALELVPESMEIRRDYATVLGWLERYEEASREFTAVFAQEPNQPIWAVREMANAHFFGGPAAEALAAFDRLIAAGHYEAPILTRRGLSLLRLERFEEAEEQYRQALGWYPESEPAAIGLGRALAAQGRTVDAYTLAVTWGAESAPESGIRIFAAKMLLELERFEEAAEAFAAIPLETLAEADARQAANRAWRQAPSKAPPGWSQPPVRKALAPPAGTASDSPSRRALELRDRGVRIAREGEPQKGVYYLEHALSIEPDNIGIIRDYAIVLGWAERYGEALLQYDRLWEAEPDQPPWTRAELARSQLFGDRPADALNTLDALIAEGHRDMDTLARRGLALRWLGRGEDASAVYRTVRRQFPSSPLGPSGLLQALADRNRLGDALDVAEDAVERFPDDAELRIGRAQVFNWAGRHVKARRVLEGLPAELLESRVVMQHRSLAARWAARPKEAFRLAMELRRAHPNDPDAERLLRDLSQQYGPALRAETEMVADSAGYSYRSTIQQAELPLSVSHRLSFLRERRSFVDEQAAVRTLDWERYGVGWEGVLGRRVTGSAAVSSVDYGMEDAGGRLMGEASVSALLSDHVSVAGGFGLAPAETLPALRERLMGRYAWGSVSLRPTLKLAAEAQYTRRSFLDAAVRRTAEFSAFHRVSQRGGHQIRLGGRSQWMWHDRSSALFWSPSFFHTQLLGLQAQGSLPGRLDYVAEAGSGIQQEAGFERQIPFVSTLELAKKLQPKLWLRFKAGYSNSSVDRINTGAGGYRFGYLNVSLDVRLGKRG